MGLYIVDLCRRDENHGFRRRVQIPFEFTQFRNEIKTKNGKFQLLCTNIFHRHVSKSYNSQEWSSFLVIYVRMYVFIWWCASWTDLKWNLILPGVTWAIKASYEELMYRCGTLMGTSSHGIQTKNLMVTHSLVPILQLQQLWITVSFSMLPLTSYRVLKLSSWYIWLD